MHLIHTCIELGLASRLMISRVYMDIGRILGQVDYAEFLLIGYTKKRKINK